MHSSKFDEYSRNIVMASTLTKANVFLDDIQYLTYYNWIKEHKGMNISGLIGFQDRYLRFRQFRGKDVALVDKVFIQFICDNAFICN